MLSDNAFALLGASVLDDKARLLELEEVCAFEMAPEHCRLARSTLLHPRERLRAELGWLPGVAPQAVANLLAADAQSVLERTDLPPLARANLLAEALAATDDEALLERLIPALGEALEQVDLNALRQTLDHERAQAGLAPLESMQALEMQWAEQRMVYRSVLRPILERLPSTSLLNLLTQWMSLATQAGQVPAPGFYDQLAELYAVETLDWFWQEHVVVERLLAHLRELVGQGPEAWVPGYAVIGEVVARWLVLAEPLCLHAQGRGWQHDRTTLLARMLRETNVDLFNQYGYLESALAVTADLRNWFVRLPDFLAQLDEDQQALESIREQRAQSERDYLAWREAMTFCVRLRGGRLFSITPEHIGYGDDFYAVTDLTRARWGYECNEWFGVAVRGGFLVAFGNQDHEVCIMLPSRQIYDAFAERFLSVLRRQLGGLLLDALAAGNTLVFEHLRLDDRGVYLPLPARFKQSEWLHVPWRWVMIAHNETHLFFWHREERERQVSVSYRDVPNVRVLEQVVLAAFDISGLERLTQLRANQ